MVSTSRWSAHARILYCLRALTSRTFSKDLKSLPNSFRVPFFKGPRDRRPRVRGKGGVFSVTAHNFGLPPPSPTMFVSTAARTFVRRAATSTGARRLASTASNAATTAELQSTQKTAAYLTAFAAVAGFGATQLTHKEVCISKDSEGMKCCYVVPW